MSRFWWNDAKLKRDLKIAVADALNETADEWRKLAQSYAPVGKTGALKRSISVFKRADPNAPGDPVVVAGSRLPYARRQEWHNPRSRRYLNRALGKAVGRRKRKITERIRRNMSDRGY